MLHLGHVNSTMYQSEKVIIVGILSTLAVPADSAENKSVNRTLDFGKRDTKENWKCSRILLSPRAAVIN